MAPRKIPPARASLREKLAGLRPAADIDIRGFPGLDVAGEIVVERVEQIQLVADRQFDIDSFDGIRVLTQSAERN